MAQTPAFYFDILEILAVGHCPGCELLRRKSMTYIDHALYALVVDPPTQNRFADSGGYCRRHAEMLFRIPWGSALGVAILYRRLTEDASAELKKADRRSGGGKSPVQKHLQPACPACTVEQEAEQGVLEAILSMLKAKDPRMMEAVTGGRGLCLRHTDAALAAAPNAETAAILRDHGLRTAQALLDELNEFIRKSDYRNTQEQKGPEGDSWMRAVSWMSGAVPEKEAKAFTPGTLKQQMRNPEETKE